MQADIHAATSASSANGIGALDALGASNAGTDADAEQVLDVKYRLALLQHWKRRVSIGNLGEHDTTLMLKVRANLRKRRKLDGHKHAQYDEPPPLFAKFTFTGHGNGDSSDEDNGNLSAAGAKKSRSAKPKKEVLQFFGDEVPFGNGPLSSERRAVWAAAMKQTGQRFRDMNKVSLNPM